MLRQRQQRRAGWRRRDAFRKRSRRCRDRARSTLAQTMPRVHGGSLATDAEGVGRRRERSIGRLRNSAPRNDHSDRAADAESQAASVNSKRARCIRHRSLEARAPPTLRRLAVRPRRSRARLGSDERWRPIRARFARRAPPTYLRGLRASNAARSIESVTLASPRGSSRRAFDDKQDRSAQRGELVELGT